MMRDEPREPEPPDQTKTCDECESLYVAATSKMGNLCPECSHWLYGYEPCEHKIVDGRCQHCHWDQSVSDFVNGLKEQE